MVWQVTLIPAWDYSYCNFRGFTYQARLTSQKCLLTCLLLTSQLYKVVWYLSSVQHFLVCTVNLYHVRTCVNVNYLCFVFDFVKRLKFFSSSSILFEKHLKSSNTILYFWLSLVIGSNPCIAQSRKLFGDWNQCIKEKGQAFFPPFSSTPYLQARMRVYPHKFCTVSALSIKQK